MPRLTDRLTLGPGLLVSPICQGATTDEDVIPAAFDAGINFFFLTADMHWPLYEQSRRGLQKLLARGGHIRDQIVVAVASYVAQPEFAWAPFEEVLQSVPGLDRIDISVVGGAYAIDYVARLEPYLAHRSQRHCGISAIGTSFHERTAARIAIGYSLVDVAYVRYNPSHPKATTDLFPHLPPERRTLLYGFNSTHGHVGERGWAALGLDADHWQPHFTDHYRYALSRPEVDGILLSLCHPAHVSELAGALERGPLSPDEQEYMRKIAQLASGSARRVG